MAPAKKAKARPEPTPTHSRRTRADIALLSVDETTAALVAAGIRPIEEFLIDDDQFILKEMPRLEPHQRWNWMEYAPRSTDFFVLDHYKRFPQDDLPTTWRNQLYEHELQTYVDSLTRSQLMAQLKTITVDDHFDKVPKPEWTVRDYQTELQSRMRERESPAPKKRTKRSE